MAGFRRAIYARMEEMSFRLGAVAAVGVLAAAGLVIALIVTLGGHSAVAANASGPGVGVRSVVASPPAASALATVPASPSARAKAKAKAEPTAAAQNYEAPAQAVVVTTPSGPALPAAAYPQPHRVKRPKLRRAPPSFPIGWFLGP